MPRKFFPTLDGTWRIVERGIPCDIDPSVDGRECYVFQRRDGGRPRGFMTHVMPVEIFWGRHG